MILVCGYVAWFEISCGQCGGKNADCRMIWRIICVDLLNMVEDGLSTILRAERESALNNCVENLTAEDRRLIEARYENGMRITQIAELESANVATTRVRLFRVRERLKACVESALAQGAVQ